MVYPLSLQFEFIQSLFNRKLMKLGHLVLVPLLRSVGIASLYGVYYAGSCRHRRSDDEKDYIDN